MSDINFVEVDSKRIERELISQYESAIGETLYPGDERRIFLLNELPVIVGLRNSINDTGRQNLLRYARGEVLDALGEMHGSHRLPAQKATVTLQFNLSAPQAAIVTIPKGTRATPDGSLYFATTEPLSISPGQTSGTVKAESAETGAKYNGFTIGQIKNIVDPVAYVSSVINTDISSGGADIEDDDSYRERIRQAPEGYSVAGPEGAYIYWGMTADSNIGDISVTSPSPGVVKVVVLMNDGSLPNQAVLDKVSSIVNARDKRPLTDNVQVAAPEEVLYDIDLTYYIHSDRQTEEAEIRLRIEEAVDQYKQWQSAKLGRAINPDMLRYMIMQAGAYRVEHISPIYTEVDMDKVARVQNITITYGGLV